MQYTRKDIFNNLIETNADLTKYYDPDTDSLVNNGSDNCLKALAEAIYKSTVPDSSSANLNNAYNALEEISCVITDLMDAIDGMDLCVDYDSEIESDMSDDAEIEDLFDN